MSDTNEPALRGDVEVDETSWGGKPRRKLKTKKRSLPSARPRRPCLGAYKFVSDKWLQSYLDEYAWRYNHRRSDQRSMFYALLAEAAK